MKCSLDYFHIVKSGSIIWTLLLAAATASCQGRTYLTADEKSWNPYIKGEKLVFRSNDRYDTLEISSIFNGAFADGFGAIKNERLRVVASHRVDQTYRFQELSFLYIYASWNESPSAIDFEFFVPNRSFWGSRYPIQELTKRKMISLNTAYGTFDDVIEIEDNSNRPFKKEDIRVIFWSRSTGYIRFEQYDGTVGELINIIK